MGEFSAEWLALREPEDAGARSLRLTLAVADRLCGSDSLRAVDLGAGTGANVRFLADYLAPTQHWLLADQDARLLGQVPAQMRTWTEADGRGSGVASGGAAGELTVRRPHVVLHLTTRSLDLSSASDLDAAIAGRDLVTASALLDLASGDWIASLVERCTAGRATVLFTLTYDGRIELAPPHAADDTIRSLVNAHQRTDKGLGPARGPAAIEAAAACLAAAGYEIHRAQSDWRLTPSDREIQRQLVEGWAAAAAAISPGSGEAVRTWRDWRVEQIEQGRSRTVVGHEDVAAWPASR